MNNQESFSKDFIRACADELGIQNIDDESIKCITDDLSFKTSLLLYQAVKLMRCCKRKRIIPCDVEGAMTLYNIQPSYGFRGKDWIPFRRAGTTSSGRDIIALDDKDIDLDDYIAQEVPKIPPNVSLKAHWLSICGAQPCIPENPQPLSEDGAEISNFAVPSRVIQEAKNVACLDITIEQQVYFKEATEACVCIDENRRKDALSSLSSDPGLQPLVARLVAFLSEGVKLNVAQQNYVQLIYLMRMLRSLVENPNLAVDIYIHELLPACASCCMSKQLCQRPKEDNHWALRTFAARQLAFIVKKYTTETNQIHSRIVKLAARVLQDPQSALVSCFGAISILGELGEEVVRSSVLPYLKTFGERVRQAEEASHHNNPLEQLTVKKIIEQVQAVVCPAVKHIMQPPDHMSDYQSKFGYFAHVILSGVVKERQSHPISQAVPPGQSPYNALLQQHQAQRQQALTAQRRQPSAVMAQQSSQQTPRMHLPVQQTPVMVKAEPSASSATTPIFGAPSGGPFNHQNLGHSLSLQSNSPAVVVGGTRIQTIARPQGAVQQAQANQPTPSNSPGPVGAPGQAQQISIRIVGQQPQQAPKQ